MHDGLMNIIEDMSKVNRDLVLALREAHADLDDVKDHIASMTDQSDKACPHIEEKVAHVTAHDSHSGTHFLELQSLVSELPESNTAFSDRKERFRKAVVTAEVAHTTVCMLLNQVNNKVEEAEDLLTYERGQTEQYKKNWQELSKACREFAAVFSVELLGKEAKDARAVMLNACEVEGHNT